MGIFELIGIMLGLGIFPYLSGLLLGVIHTSPFSAAIGLWIGGVVKTLFYATIAETVLRHKKSACIIAGVLVPQIVVVAIAIAISIGVAMKIATTIVNLVWKALSRIELVTRVTTLVTKQISQLSFWVKKKTEEYPNLTRFLVVIGKILIVPIFPGPTAGAATLLPVIGFKKYILLMTAGYSLWAIIAYIMLSL